MNRHKPMMITAQTAAGKRLSLIIRGVAIAAGCAALGMALWAILTLPNSVFQIPLIVMCLVVAAIAFTTAAQELTKQPAVTAVTDTATTPQPPLAQVMVIAPEDVVPHG